VMNGIAWNAFTEERVNVTIDGLPTDAIRSPEPVTMTMLPL